MITVPKQPIPKYEPPDGDERLYMGKYAHDLAYRLVTPQQIGEWYAKSALWISECIRLHTGLSDEAKEVLAQMPHKNALSLTRVPKDKQVGWIARATLYDWVLLNNEIMAEFRSKR